MTTFGKVGVVILLNLSEEPITGYMYHIVL